MKRRPVLFRFVSIALLASACAPALPSIGYFSPVFSPEQFWGTWKIKKSSGMKILGQGLLQYTFTDYCVGEYARYTVCEVETKSGLVFEYDYDLNASDIAITIYGSSDQNAGLIDGSYYVFSKGDDKMAWENVDVRFGPKSYVFTRVNDTY